MSRIKFEAIPDDLLYHIISHLQVQDILRLRRVCTNFQRITDERTVWLNAYRNATVLRPPHVHQSTKDLEECLVKAIRLHENWTSPSPQPVTKRNLIPAASFLHSAQLVLGRFLLVGILGQPGWLRCYDIDFDDSWNLPIASYEALLFDTLDSRVMTDADGRKSALIALFPKVTTSPITVLKMLLPPSRVAFHLEFITQTEWRLARFIGTRIVGDYLVLFTSSETKIFHLPTRRYYCMPETDSWVPELTNVRYHEYLITPTHLIDFGLALRGKTSLMQAFLLPHIGDQLEPSSEPIPALTRTHVGYCDFTFTEPQLLHPAALNSSSFTFMAFESTNSMNPPTNNLIIVNVVLSRQQLLGTITATKFTKVLDGSMDYNIIHTSRGGITRAITYSGITTFKVYGFTIVNDSDGTSVERRALPIHNHLGRVMAGAFDGYRGRICLLLDSPNRIEIMDYV